MNNTLVGINSRITEAEEWINDLGDRMVEITAKEQNKKDNLKKKRKQPKRPLRKLNTPTSALQGVPEGEEKEPETIFKEIIAENFPNMGKEIVNQVQEVERVPGRINPRRNTPKHIVIKLTKIKDKDKILKARREN